MMNSYLTNIAIRNNPDTQPFLTPSIPATAVPDPGITGAGEDFAEEGNSIDDAPSIVPVQTYQDRFFLNQGNNLVNQDVHLPQNTKPIEPLIIDDRAESGVSEKNRTMPYFARHAARIIVNEKNNVNEEDIHIPSDTSIPTVRFNREDDYSEKSSMSKDKVPADRINGVAELNTGLQIEPAVKDEKQRTTKDRVNISKLTRLIPVPELPVPAKNRPDQMLNKQATPKLVIGKITVEILPPAVPPPPKVVTRVVQPALTENHSKMSRLSFGLGQL